MSDDLSRIWGWRKEALLARLAGIELRLSRLESTPTATPSTSQGWLARIAAKAVEKLGREALTQFALWIAAKLAMWVAPWFLAWWTMGGPLLRAIERWAAFLFG